MNIWLSIIILAIIQGLTEFLPVSSSGHLALFSALFGMQTDAGLSLGIVLHAGSLLAIIAFYFKTLLGFFRKDQRHLLFMVILGTIPAGIAGVLLKKSGLAEQLFGDLLSIGLAFMVTGALLRLTGKPKFTEKSTGELKEITVKQVLIVGVTQAFAILPGISRSGSTIATGILSGIKFEAAATFSFLLALPAIGGAMLLELLDLCKQGSAVESFSVPQLAAGFILSASVSFASLALLVKLLKSKKFAYFSWYLTVLGVAVVLWQMIKLAKG